MQECGVKPALVKGGSGIFDVVVDGALMFSKHRAGRFPDAAEIVQAIRKLMHPN
jgi:selT/selW/selH-like putative selenoprotein